MISDVQRWHQNHWLNMWLTELNISIWTKRTLQQDAKSNNAVQDDEQHNVALKRRNHEKHKKKKKKLDICGNHLFRSKERKEKIKMDDSRSKNDSKPLILDEWKRNRT